MRQLFCLFIILTFFCISCNTAYPFEGKVLNVEYGKDGYTATLLKKTGDTLSALFSKVNMGNNYITLEVGDNIELDGDSMDLDNHIHVVTSIVRRK